jgi:hypothetical protein
MRSGVVVVVVAAGGLDMLVRDPDKVPESSGDLTRLPD